MPRLRTHPGEVLREEYLKPLALSARALAKSLGVPANRITEIMRGERDVSADTAIRSFILTSTFYTCYLIFKGAALT